MQAATQLTNAQQILDDTNQARGFAALGTAGGVGRLIGPAVGGFLSQPAQRYPSVFGGVWLWEKYPYLLPCLVTALCNSLLCAGMACNMDETLPAAKLLPLRERVDAFGRRLVTALCRTRTARPTPSARATAPSVPSDATARPAEQSKSLAKACGKGTAVAPSRASAFKQLLGFRPRRSDELQTALLADSRGVETAALRAKAHGASAAPAAHSPSSASDSSSTADSTVDAAELSAQLVEPMPLRALVRDRAVLLSCLLYAVHGFVGTCCAAWR